MMDSPVRRRGFTLVEVLLVIVILGMLATVAIVSLRGTSEGARIDTTQALVHEIETALDAYQMHLGSFPGDAEGGLQALLVKPDFQNDDLAAKWRGPYLKKEPKDAWGNALLYELVDDDSTGVTRRVPHVWSPGPNGEDERGAGDDIKNWKDES